LPENVGVRQRQPWRSHSLGTPSAAARRSRCETDRVAEVVRWETGEGGENIMFTSGREKPRRRFWQRPRSPWDWSAQEIDDHVIGCYLLAKSLSVVVGMPEDEMPRKYVRGFRKANDGDYRGFEWWGFGWGGDMLAMALLEGPHVLCETWGAFPTEAEAQEAAKDFLGGEGKETSLGDLDRWPLLAVLTVVRAGPGNVFPEE
jgi:hypothetical protein